MVTPVMGVASRRVWYIGAAPRYLHTSRGVKNCNMSEAQDSYIGSRDGWTLMPPYLTALMMRSGIKRPKEAATRRFISPLEEASGSS